MQSSQSRCAAVLVVFGAVGALGACGGGGGDVETDGGGADTDGGAPDGAGGAGGSTAPDAGVDRAPETGGAVGVGPCRGEQFTRGFGSAAELYCHKIDVPPAGVYYHEEFCFTFNADGTGKIDIAGGYDEAPRLITATYMRANDIRDFQWGALMEKSGTFKRVGADNALQIFWRRPGQDFAVDTQMPLLYWDDAKRTFVMVNPPIHTPLPATANNGACMFGPPACIKSATREACWAGGYLDGAYKELSNGKVTTEGTYTKGVKTGTWKTYNYSFDGQLFSHDERDYLAGGTEKDYRERRFEYGALKEEGDVRNGVRHGLWKTYWVDDPRSSVSSKRNANGLVQEEGSYDKGTKMGVWTLYKIRYDLEVPDRAAYPSYSAWDVANQEYLMRRKGIGTCKSMESDTARRWTKSYIYGRPFCPSAICNAGLTEIIVNADGVKSCYDAAEVQKMCPTSGATCA